VGRGFTLIEVAIAVFVITLLLGGILVPLATQVELRKISETQKALDETRDALLGFALANGYLPCPDKTTSGGAGTENDGQEDVSLGICVVSDGNLPWVTLGTANADIWGNRIRYAIHLSFARRTPAIPGLFTLITTSNLRACTTSACSSLLTTSSDGPPAVILSHGKNGLGGRNATTNAANPAPVSADELENTDGDTTFVSRAQSATGSGAGEFDDVVTWIPRSVLLNRMVAAGKLP
jgi:prepilin-type N-terminal cleavage/methylation domain-containing protein